jgi:hypothetical protein
VGEFRRFEWEVPRSIPIHGYWSVLYGNLATVQIGLGGSQYVITATTQIRIGKSNHWLPSGTLLAKFWRTSEHSCSGEHSMYFVESGQFARWSKMMLTLSSDGKRLDGLIYDKPSLRIEFSRSYISG